MTTTPPPFTRLPDSLFVHSFFCCLFFVFSPCPVILDCPFLLSCLVFFSFPVFAGDAKQPSAGPGAKRPCHHAPVPRHGPQPGGEVPLLSTTLPLMFCFSLLLFVGIPFLLDVFFVIAAFFSFCFCLFLLRSSLVCLLIYIYFFCCFFFYCFLLVLSFFAQQCLLAIFFLRFVLFFLFTLMLLPLFLLFSCVIYFVYELFPFIFPCFFFLPIYFFSCVYGLVSLAPLPHPNSAIHHYEVYFVPALMMSRLSHCCLDTWYSGS